MGERDASYDIFISYAHADDRDGFISALRDTIEAEVTAFVERGVDVCFFDKSHIRTMADWEEATILSGLRSSRLLLAVLSPNYFLSPFCWREWLEFTRLGSEEALANILGDCATIYIEPCPPFDASEQLTAAELAQRLVLLAEERAAPPERTPIAEPGIAEELANWAAFLRRPQRVELHSWRDKGVDALKDNVVRKRMKLLT
ncbi:toll/interleukin-1 receptor domain-containing protein [Halomonas sp. 1390]|uniref:toll/interleukin-1 receptor domain-containing protein n=1 Tax=Halomonas sp. B23F22_3 TaxID=3459516 RepID=UPI00373F25D4